MVLHQGSTGNHSIVLHWYISQNVCYSVVQWTSVVYACQKSISSSFEMEPWTYIGKTTLSLLDTAMELSIKMSPFPLAKRWTCDPSYTNQMFSSPWNLKLMWNAEKGGKSSWSYSIPSGCDCPFGSIFPIDTLATFPRLTLRLCKDVPYSSVLQYIPLWLLGWVDFCCLHLTNPNWYKFYRWLHFYVSMLFLQISCYSVASNYRDKILNWFYQHHLPIWCTFLLRCCIYPQDGAMTRSCLECG